MGLANNSSSGIVIKSDIGWGSAGFIMGPSVLQEGLGEVRTLSASRSCLDSILKLKKSKLNLMGGGFLMLYGFVIVVFISRTVSEKNIYFCLCK